MESIFDIAVFESLCRRGARFIYMHYQDSELDEVEFGVVTKTTLLKFEITWLVVKSTSGCLGLTWKDVHTYNDMPFGRWCHMTQTHDDLCGLMWMYTPLQ